MFKNFVKIILLIVNIVVVIAMLIPAFSQYFPPSEFPFLSYFGLFFLPLVLLNVFFALFWIIKLKIYAAIPIIAILLVSGDIRTSFSLFKQKQENTETGVKVLTYNVMLFNYYDKKSKTIDYINNSGADIVCLQEFGWHRNGKEFLSKEKIISSLTNYPYYHINIALDEQNVTYGIATFSKFPIINKQLIDYESYFNSSIYSDLKIGNDTIRVFNNHLESNRLSKKEKEKLVEKMDSEIINQMTKKMSVAAAIRAKQANTIAGEIDKSPYPVIVCGDFNDIAVSYSYKKISKNLQDTFIGSGKGLGITFSDKQYRFRIDYILLNQNFKYYEYHIDKVTYSDHYPVFCNVMKILK